ncbi:MAG: hypothetical protein KY447_04460 [Actinobacteria bacterium]|nr:hypothetical protein [Actinomycetota bacterium]MBW3642148.1 hypothetical protein [Actinomycetota bacterium]
MPLSLQEIDRRVARFVWVEQRRFEVLGGWAATVAEPDVKALLATQAHHHAWHASLWEGHLPRRSGHDRTDAAAPGDDALRTFVDALRLPDATLERLVGAYRVVAAHAIAAYTAHLERSTGLGDAAVARTCRLVVTDQLDDWRQGEKVLQSLLHAGDDVDRAGRHLVHLERLLLDAGGFAGAGVHRP